jgi:osmotically-inducible protein OsmY
MNVRGPVLIVVLTSAIGLAACTQDTTPEPQTLTQTADPRSDAELATEVQGRFYADDIVRAGRIDVNVDDGVVTLSGTAQNEQAKERALEIAREVPSVTRVEDNLLIAPAVEADRAAAAQDAPRQAQAENPLIQEREDPTNPAWITTKIQAQYFIDPDVKPWNVDVTTRPGGIVVLRGQVDGADAKSEAVRIARETEGVGQVEDFLQVSGESQQIGESGEAAAESSDISDAWLTAKVQSKYYIDNDVRGLDIDVTTENGVVTLTGTVETPQERRQAVALARNTEGVRDVRDQLMVQADTEPAGATAGRQPAPASQPGDREVGTAGTSVVEDAWITTKIQSQYFLDPLVKGHEINVDTMNGVVTLAGSVESDQHKQMAEQIARETEGVRRVDNRLTIGQ